MTVQVLRLGHRHVRDKRLSTHLALTARAFGADRILYDVEAGDVKESVDQITESWGGSFTVEYVKDYRRVIREFGGLTVHLTMYGLLLGDVVAEFSGSDLLVVVGGSKVPSDIYDLVDYNVQVGGQPHSEVAALAVLLDRYFGGRELIKDFGGKKTVVPQMRGKKLRETE